MQLLFEESQNIQIRKGFIIAMKNTEATRKDYHLDYLDAKSVL